MDQNYQNIEDFLKDESFLAWAKGESNENGKSWETWGRENAHAANLMEEARLMVLGLPFEEVSIDQQEFEGALARLQAAIPEEKNVSSSKRRSMIPLKWVALILLLISSAFFLNQYFSEIEMLSFQTTFAETREIKLEDGSEILLNANSKIWYSADIQSEKVKEIWLEGEAYFDIKAQEKGSAYLIHAGNIDSRIIGTSFNLNTRSEFAFLSLDEGLIEVSHASGQKVELLSGKGIYFDENIQEYVLQSGRNRYWNSWREQMWVFDEETSFGNILQRIETEFGVKIEVKNTALQDRRLKGSVSIENIEVLLESISFIFDIEIKRTGDSVLYIE